MKLLTNQARWRYSRVFWLVLGLVLSVWLSSVVLWWILRALLVLVRGR